jgi:catechol 2,3-dioxygenase-like lactoylglutathione lyase family enzyme
MINLYSKDLAMAAAFYTKLGFVEGFRTPEVGEPVHIELALDGFTLGIATVEAAREHHGLRPEGEGRWIEIVLWTEDVDTAVRRLTAEGAPVLSAPHDFPEGALRAAWVADPDGNPIQIVQELGGR